MYSIEEIAGILQAKAIIKKQGEKISYLLTDSRRVAFPTSSLFIALHSERRNGHDFIGDVFEQGVRNFIVEREDEAEAFEANFLLVENTLKALQQLAAYHRSTFHYPVVGITGSNGKTIVKEWLYQLLSPCYNIIRSPRSYNSQIGVPLSVWQMGNRHNLGLFEAGISERGEMEILAQIIRPTVGVLTNIGEAHKEGFNNIEEKAREKFRLFDDAETVICNGDDFVVQQTIPNNHHYKIFSWGRKRENEVVILSVHKIPPATVIHFIYEKKEFEVTIPFTDDASIQNAFTCLCVMLYLNIDISVVQKRIKELHAVEMRLQLVQAINGSSLINDSYSFDISSFTIALDFLLQQHQYPFKTVILSDLPGKAEDSLYADVATMLEVKNIMHAIAIGEKWQRKQQLLSSKIAITEFYRTTEDFLHHFHNNQFKNEAILLKGARTFAFERIVSVLEKKVHQTVMEINLTAMAHNLKQYQSQLRAGTKLMAMVKAFGYGSGSAEIGNLLQFHKVDYLAVAYTDEGVDLRKANIRLPILVLNVDEAAFDALIENNLEPELFSFEIFKAFDNYLQKQGLQQYPVHLKIDTGMHRLGFEEKDLSELSILLRSNHRIAVKSVFSHLAASEDPNEDAFTQQQVNVFNRCCKKLEEILAYPFIKHIANSAAIFRHTNTQLDMVRLGIGLYGIDSSAEHHLDLQTVCTLKTTVAQLRQVKAGDTIGYNRRGKVARDSLIATIRIGYADGFSRKLSNGIGHVYIKDKTAPVIGTVCMDMTMIDVTDIEGVQEGDEVEIFGANIPVQQVAQWCKTISYEILTNINQRVKRVYVEE